MYLCLHGHECSTEWRAEHCEVCNPYPCERCDERYPSAYAAFQCCRD